MRNLPHLPLTKFIDNLLNKFYYIALLISRKMNSHTKVLISGGSGMIGRYLTSLLLAEGFTVAHLSRQQNQFGKVRVFRWDPEKEIIDPVILDGMDYIIHLAGANIGEKRWTKKRKQEVAASRVVSAKLLYKVIRKNKIGLKAFISASATGYYGSVTSEHIYTEEDPPADDFLATTCRLWEEAADLFENSGIRTVKIRTAMVLEKSAGALSMLLSPARFGIFPVMGKGSQYMPWIHISDLCAIYLKAVKDENMAGAYNAVSPEHVTQKEFMRILSQSMKRRFFHLPVPAILLKAYPGEMSDLVLKGSRLSSEKIIKAGYHFTFKYLYEALDDLINQ